MKRITFNVTRKHWQAALDSARIRNGEIQIQSSDCPVAQALRGEFEFIRVLTYVYNVPEARLGPSKNSARAYRMSKAGQSLVSAFDTQEWDDQDWTRDKPQGKPTLSKGTRMPKFPVRVTLTLDPALEAA